MIYKWVDYLKSKGDDIAGHVIMPNHLHTLIVFTNTSQGIYTIVGNGKRFIAYEISPCFVFVNQCPDACPHASDFQYHDTPCCVETHSKAAEHSVYSHHISILGGSSGDLYYDYRFFYNQSAPTGHPGY